MYSKKVFFNLNLKRQHSLRQLCLIILLFFSCVAFAQKGYVKGNVSDMKGEPLTGVTVMVTGSKTGVATDVDGNYVIKADKGTTLEFRYIGFDSRTEAVGSRSIINVVLKEASDQLEEVVVVGYGT